MKSGIQSLGFSTGLGFVHTGKLLSFVYDITWIFDIPLHEEQDNQMNVGNLWDDTGEITGGKNHAGDSGWL